MSQSKLNNTRIAKNTVFLFLRSIFTLLISLYTSRVVLATLGIDDYGIYIVVGGVVAMFSSFSGALSSSISRFITYELGKESNNNLNKVFSTSVLIQLILGTILILIIVFGGGWFLNEKMNIAEQRLDAANWVLVCSAVAFGIGLISVAYNAMIIAHEHMKAFAYIGILQVSLKLAIVFLLVEGSFDKLKLYAVLSMCVAIAIQFVYIIYCRVNFRESRFHYVWDISLLKSMSSFSGWAFFSSSVAMMNTQGINILINLFFGVSLNAARGVATTVENALSQFIGNFTTAMNPQIIKSYASDNKTYMFQLICSGSKFAYFLALLFVIPLFIEADTVLKLWLGDVPEYAAVFLRLTLLTMLPQVLAGVLFTAAMATGDIKRYALVVNGLSVFVFIISLGLYWIGFPPETAYFVHFIMRILLIAVRLFLLKNMISLSPMQYVKEVLFRIVPITLLAFSLLYIIPFSQIPESLLKVLLVSFFSAIVTIVFVTLFGITKNERNFVLDKLQLLKLKFIKVNK